ncbi:MAG TPA: DMT family transporter [Anaeromyxobacteraceae bacterium]|nr:DMT family transporter [Anaeromyxobacteraceae bacterium]
MVNLLLFLHSALSAGTYLAAKRALGELSPFELALVRFVLAGAVYTALLLRSPPRLPRRDLVVMAGLGLLAVPLNQGLFLAGLARTTPGHAALLYALTPVFVFLLARVRLGERAGPARLAGIALAFAGVLVVLAARGLLGGEGAGRGLLGDLLVLLGVVAWAVYIVLGKPYAERYGAVTTTGLSLVMGTLLYLPLGLPASELQHFRALSTGGWAAVGYLVILTSVVSYLIYYWALGRAEASRVAIWSNTQPVLTALLAWALHGERLTASFLAGGAMVLMGVVLTERA